MRQSFAFAFVFAVAAVLVTVRAVGSATPPAAAWWQPGPDASLHWQLSGLPVDPAVEASAFDIDLFDSPAALVAVLHARQRKVICYISAGTRENWRPDASAFPDRLVGHDDGDWPGERWLDIRAIAELAPILRARLDLCRAKGFDAVEVDNVDGYQNNTGFALTAEDQLRFNRWLAAEAHQRGLSIGLKNDPDQAGELVRTFDWALAESCFEDGWCADMEPFVAAGKPVFMVEYTDQTDSRRFRMRACALAARLGFHAQLKKRELDAFRLTCPAAPETAE